MECVISGCDNKGRIHIVTGDKPSEDARYDGASFCSIAHLLRADAVVLRDVVGEVAS